MAAVAPRYEVQALDAYSLGETIDLVGYPGDHTVFEAPPLVSGQRLHGAREAEVGRGLAQVLGLSPGSPLAVELPSGRELRLQVAGVVDSLQHDGRVVYVPASTLLAGEASARATRRAPERRGQPGCGDEAARCAGARPTRRRRDGQRAQPDPALSAILRAVAIVDGLVCMYALLQALFLTARERRTTIAVLRACGAGSGAVRCCSPVPQRLPCCRQR